MKDINKELLSQLNSAHQ